MITQRRQGSYKLIETKHNTKILYLDNEVYAWIEPSHIGEVLIASHKIHRSDCVLSMGHFHLYEVEDEPYLSDQQHLELEVGQNKWQGYLLPTGLPDDHKKRSRIIPTIEIITGNRRYAHRKEIYRNLATA